MAIATRVSPPRSRPAEVNGTPFEQKPIAPKPRAKGTKRWGLHLRRFIYVTGAVAAGFALLVILGLWAFYRMNHVVTHSASVTAVVSQVGSRLDGRVAVWRVEPNQQISAGEVLAELDNAHLAAAMEAAQAELARAQQEHKMASLALFHKRSRMAARLELSESRQELARETAQLAKHTLDRWTRERNRLQNINVRGAVTASTLDNVTLEQRTAQRTVNITTVKNEIAALQLQLAAIDVDSLVVDEAQLGLLASNIDAANASLALAKADLESTILRAPGDGRLAARRAQAGDSVQVGDPIATFWVGDAWLEAWVDESQLSYVEPGQEVDIRMSAHPGKTFVGKVQSLGVISDAGVRRLSTPGEASPDLLSADTSKIAVRIALPKGCDVCLMPGLSARVGIRAPEKRYRKAISYLASLRQLAPEGWSLQ